MQPVDHSKLGTNGQRVIRISFRGQPGSFRFRIDQCPIEKFRNADFTNVMTQLQLSYGDIVVWETQRDKSGKELTNPEDITTWWFKHLKDVRASFYAIPADSFSDFFAAPIYHWKASPEKPRPLKSAQFFVDGVALGEGAPGFQAMMDAIDKTKTRGVVIFAPRIKNENQGPWIAFDQLSDWAQDAGVDRQRFDKFLTGRYADFLDFARIGDEEF